MTLTDAQLADADAVFRVMAGYDPADPWSRPLPVAAQPPSLPSGLRVGVPDPGSRHFGGDALSEGAFEAGLADLAGLTGPARPVDLSAPFAVAGLLYTGPWVAERYEAARVFLEERPESLHPVFRRIAMGANEHSAADAFAGIYRLTELRRTCEAIWDAVDVLAVPSYPRPRTLADLQADPIGPNSELGTYTNFVNLLDLCALAVPSRMRGAGFPSGITLIAPHGQDGLLAALGARLHAAAGVGIGAGGQPVPAPIDGPARARSDEIELAVVGAHLSGLPLNRELTQIGGRYLRGVRTTPDYRLYALPGGPPARPGLLRVGDGLGAAIETEVWALPQGSFGRFVAGIPAPLGIGTVRLADRTAPKGFLTEAEGAAGAEDISAFGGWRAYRAERPA